MYYQVKHLKAAESGNCQVFTTLSGPDINNQPRRIVSEENLFLRVHRLANRDSSHLLSPREEQLQQQQLLFPLYCCLPALIGLPVKLDENRKVVLEQLPCSKRKKMADLDFCNHGKLFVLFHLGGWQVWEKSDLAGHQQIKIALDSDIIVPEKLKIPLGWLLLIFSSIFFSGQAIKEKIQPSKKQKLRRGCTAKGQ